MGRGWIRAVSFTLWCALSAGGVLAAARQPQPALNPRRMILYDASPFFFAPGGRNGFAAIEAHLPAIAALGANAILLSPVTAASPGDFGYAVTDDFRLRTRFGSAAQLRALIRAAHSLGMRVLLDMAANHLSDQSPYYRDAQRRGRKSPYYGWFERDASGRAVHYFDWTNLENLDYANPAVRKYVLDAFSYWLANYHVDGFRLDAAWALRQRDPGFWPRLRARLAGMDPNIILIAEASGRDGYYVTHGFDAAYDWTSQLGQWAWEGVFTRAGVPNLVRLRAALINGGKGYPASTLLLRFLDNNDTGERFISRYGVGETRAAIELLFTLPGIPLIYDGDEVGAAFQPYAEGPPIVWRDPYGLTPLYARMSRERRAVRALTAPGLQLLATDRDAQVLAYLRPGCRGDTEALVVLNFDRAPVRVRLHATPAVADFSRARAQDLATGRQWLVALPARTLALPPYGGVIVLSRVRSQASKCASSANRSGGALVSQSESLSRNLHNRHIQLIALGGTIGVGLFLGSAQAIHNAGPGLLLGYVVGGVAIFFIMRALGELLTYRPVAGSFASYADEFCGPFAGFVTGWSYWFMWILTAMAELTAIGVYVRFWLPSVPQWLPPLVALVALYGANLVAVRVFGELEFWFALIKVVTIVALILGGLAVIFFHFGDFGAQASFGNLWSHGGFLPFGMLGVLLTLQMVTFAYSGVELIGVTAGEAENPAVVLPRATNGITYRILIFYIGALVIIMALVPWNQLSPDMSPFVFVFQKLGIPAAASIINIVVITAATSSCNSGIFSTGRMLYSLACRGQGPRAFASLSGRNVPAAGIHVSAAVMLIGVFLNYVVPKHVFVWVTSISLIGTLWTWGIIMVSHLGYRRAVRDGRVAAASFRMPGGAVVNWLVLAFLLFVTAMLWLQPDTRVALYVAPVWFALLAVSYFSTRPQPVQAA